MADRAPERSLPARPTFALERNLWRSGIIAVAGVDEVGRGALAGPLYAAAVVFPSCEGPKLRELLAALHVVHDSKLLTPAQRQACVEPIVRYAVSYAVACVDSEELDAVGVNAANRLAMERAVEGLSVDPDLLLLDARVIETPIAQIAPIKGDRLSLSIAAAAILAKVERDRVMATYDAVYPEYGFGRHKGYGTPSHLRAIRAYGPCPIHRQSFALYGRCASGETDG